MPVKSINHGLVPYYLSILLPCENRVFLGQVLFGLVLLVSFCYPLTVFAPWPGEKPFGLSFRSACTWPASRWECLLLLPLFFAFDPSFFSFPSLFCG